ncbi:hypothetical protein [Mycoplasma zalophidermidis]|uniref:ABC transporter permease n=1 Tax=Mycoplasma zalophidermidis TaxID=398174 RepID=A0ABS6DRK1_9MOLU|nr:hypothetical protein [Mycoplasma zalophidermidis]MBU4689852.1 hypothetical protein [Mycoplasma zalophidermidis]MBU4693638.1 hypothetical protein [Mycoplasma zalophidermidis]MCR8966722.1 hypothetical protein [Mycoplasma zalophidermidis]
MKKLKLSKIIYFSVVMLLLMVFLFIMQLKEIANINKGNYFNWTNSENVTLYFVSIKWFMAGFISNIKRLSDWLQEPMNSGMNSSKVVIYYFGVACGAILSVLLSIWTIVVFIMALFSIFQKSFILAPIVLLFIVVAGGIIVSIFLNGLFSKYINNDEVNRYLNIPFVVLPIIDVVIIVLSSIASIHHKRKNKNNLD